MATLIVRLDVDADPTVVDPHTVVEEILDIYCEEARVGNANYVVAEQFFEAEWED
jgi:hypothetical protein